MKSPLSIFSLSRFKPLFPVPPPVHPMSTTAVERSACPLHHQHYNTNGHRLLRRLFFKQYKTKIIHMTVVKWRDFVKNINICESKLYNDWVQHVIFHMKLKFPSKTASFPLSIATCSPTELVWVNLNGNEIKIINTITLSKQIYDFLASCHH